MSEKQPTFSLLLLLVLVPTCKRSDKAEIRGSANSSRAQADTSSETAQEGVLADTPSGKIKVYAIRSGLFRVWLMDKGGTALSTDRAKVRLKLDTVGYPEIALEPHGNYFQGKGPELLSEHAEALVTSEIDGKTETARVRLHMESGATGQHHDRDER